MRDLYLKAFSKYKRLRSASEDAARAAGLPKPAESKSSGSDPLLLASQLLEKEAEMEVARGRYVTHRHTALY